MPSTEIIVNAGREETRVALLENGQTRQGTVRLPQALWPFINGARELGAGER